MDRLITLVFKSSYHPLFNKKTLSNKKRIQVNSKLHHPKDNRNDLNVLKYNNSLTSPP